MLSKTLTIMFTDIKDFTRRTRVQSREQHLILLEKHETLILPSVQKYRGKIVKTLGDSFLIIFESPTNALLCAIEIQQRLTEYNQRTDNADEKIEIKIGINSGEVNIANSDISGDPVNVAARVVSITQANDIYFTEAVYLTMNRSEVPHYALGEKILKGLDEPIKLFKVLKPGEKPGNAPGGTESISHSSLSNAVDQESESQFTEEKLDPDKVGELFDFTNIEFEKKYEQALSEKNDDSSKKTEVEILELDSSKHEEAAKSEDILETTDTDKDEKGLEHSREILSTIRQEKSRKKTIIKATALSVAVFLIGLLLIYKHISDKKQEIREEELKKNSAIFEALEPTPQPSKEPTIKSRFKPIKSIEYATLKIVSIPSKATVYFNGRKMKKRTPTILRKIKPNKSYRLSIDKKGYEPYTVFFDLGPGEEKRVKAKLSRKRN